MYRRSLAAGVLAIVLAGSAHAAPARYDSPDAAVAAVIAALDARDRDALITVFGPENEDVILTGDPEQDRATWSEFLAGYNQAHRIVESDDGATATLFIGDEVWPVPLPLVRGDDGQWAFDMAAGRDEVLTRRIGENELEVLDLLRAYVRVQAAYRQIDYDGDGVMEFAAAILSSPGARDGLFWPETPGAPPSPIGDFVARASAGGFAVGGDDVEAEPYLGYYYRILNNQGPGAPGGEYDYMVNGNMVGGHAMIAFPSAYGETGIMSFLVGENGIIYEADLGDETLSTASGIEAFNPGDPWFVVE